MFRDEQYELDDRIACRSCGDSFPAPEGASLIWALKDSCPLCGGELILLLDGADAPAPVGVHAHAA